MWYVNRDKWIFTKVPTGGIKYKCYLPGHTAENIEDIFVRESENISQGHQIFLMISFIKATHDNSRSLI